MPPPICPAGCLPAIILAAAVSGWGAPAILAGANQEQAAPASSSTVANGPASRPLSLEQRADIFMARKNYGDAADYYFRALKQSSMKDPLLWNKLGIAFQQQNKFASARKAYTNATRVKKDFAEAWNNEGTVYYMERKYARSVKYYLQAIELAKDNASFHMNLGTSYYHLKKYDLAVEEYRTALGIDPTIMSQRQSALATTVHAPSGTDVEFYFYLAKAFASIGNAEDAVRYLRRALEDGFSDSKRIDADPDFQKISQYPAFVELMRNPPVAIKE